MTHTTDMPSAAPTDPCPWTHRQKILIVDDKQENLIALRRTLACLDVEIIEASSGNQALVATLDNDFAVAVVDVKMPGMDGYELAAILREEERTRVLPIIFNTAATADEHQAFKGYEAGCIDYIVKPVDPAILIGKVRTLLELDTHRRQLEQMVEARTLQLSHLNSVLLGIRHVNQLIVREKKPARLIRDACRKLIETRGFHFAFITLLDASGKLETAAETGLGNAFPPFLDNLKAGTLSRCYEKALIQPTPVLTRLPHGDCAGCPLSGKSRDHAAITIRLEHADRVYGLMTLAMPRQLASDLHELSLLEEAGGDLAFALHTIEKELRLRMVLDNMRDVIWLMDMNLYPIWISAARSRGYTADELKGLPLSKQMTPDSYRRVMEAYNTTITPESLTDPLKKLSITMEIEFTRKDGSSAWASATFAVVRDDAGTPIGIVGSSHDIGKLKASEAALMMKTRALTERVKELHCLYEVSRIAADSNAPIREVLQEVVSIIPAGWFYPELTCARITCHRHRFTSTGFRETPWTLSADILVSGEEVGQVEVFVLKECPPLDEGPFLKEERELIDNLARRMGTMLEARRSRSRDRLARDVLELLNRKERSPDFLEEILSIIRRSTHVEALGIRLRDGDECPYGHTQGFSEHFVQAEALLCRRGADGSALRNSKGEALLDGLCGRVLSGGTVPRPPGFTDGGSFWTNSTETWGQPAPSPIQEACPRNLCSVQGFQSVALIPLKADEQILGLLHLGDSRPGCFNREMIHFFEGLGTSIGIALAKNRVEGALRESETLLNEMGAMAKVGGWELDLSTRAMRWTRETYRIHEIPEGKPVTLAEALAFCDTTSRPAMEKALASCRKTATPFDLELHVTTAGGRNLQARVTGRAAGPAGKVEKLTGTFQDITKHKKLEEQLHQAMKMEAIGRLAGGVAHDFNNALTPILAVSGMLLNDLSPEEPMHEDIREIQEAADRCARLTRQLLAFGRRQPMRLTCLNLNTVVSRMEKMLSRIIGEDIKLVKRLAPDLGNTRADEGKMEQIIANLAVNARDAMPRGGTLTIETRNVTDDAEPPGPGARPPGPMVMLVLTDTGEGMNEKTQAHIFDPFFTTKENGKGTGLGLATVYGIVKQSRGNIRVRSRPGQGTCFRVCLPRVDESTSCPAPPRAPAPKPSSRGTETILLVEDEESVRRTARRILAGKGYTVLEASHGEEAITRFKTHTGTIHILVTDVIMPGMSGKEVADHLVTFAPTLKVLYVSGYTDNVISRRGVLDHGTSFIQKPFTSEDLAAKVRKVLDS
ncbi:response regulator [Desulfoluna butyratoxydans]|uniref:histidine kinase n=1 Tax=Desulfoluna butyratoxydans TaxID=231438 RepID=A0A4U8YN36_9BACT|nr:response regulator [Desulfoluna butyratoxydans]VFQ43052.1 pas fold-3 [Desulfoluna butyratoxydans]